MPETANELEAGILIGGKSRRMGRHKPGLVVDGRTMLERVLDAVSPLVTRVRLVGSSSGPEQAIRSDIATNYELQPDLRPGLGPLAGIYSALATARAPAVIVLACDLPFVTEHLLAGLRDALSGPHDAVIPRDRSGRLVPVCAVYRTTCTAPLEQQLERGELAAHAFADAVRTRVLEGEALERLDPEGICLRNVNTPADLAEAQDLARLKRR